VEARDWASGTSSRSSKLIHGGLRYLEMLDFGLVREALRERGLLLRQLAPHLVRPVPFLFPLQHRGWERLYVGAGVALYDTMALASGAKQGIPSHRHLSRGRALDRAAELRPDALVGAIQYWDAQVDDARYTMTLVRTAAHYGAIAANRTEVTAYVRDGERVVGAELHDLESGERFTVRARRVVNATGVWSGTASRLANADSGPQVRASKGVHILVPRGRLELDSGLILRTARSVLFVIPWREHWIVGTTDTDWQLDRGRPAASAADIGYLLDEVNRVLRRPLTTADIVGVYVGLRPLVSSTATETTKTSREHVVDVPVPGLVTVAGGKYTTYRVMAADAVDAAVRDLDTSVPASCTADVPLVGAIGFRALWNRRASLALESGLNAEQVESLLTRYGDRTPELLSGLADDPRGAQPLPGSSHLLGEIGYAATHEGARHLDDVLARRTHISIESWDRGVSAAPAAAEEMARHLGWDQATVDREVRTYLERVRTERVSQAQPDDSTADAARRQSREILPPAWA
ncbi:MAG: glycerol-3-phosphate dehydrogenase/oxidase, partial [Actinobacteria bacterium]|nr:glycerol-3-phosphate dehydrogenase/oxidase [Actinomycetota bacterium]